MLPSLSSELFLDIQDIHDIHLHSLHIIQHFLQEHATALASHQPSSGLIHVLERTFAAVGTARARRAAASKNRNHAIAFRPISDKKRNFIQMPVSTAIYIRRRVDE